RYPDAGAFTLKSALGESYGLSSDHLLLGNGSEESVQMIAKAFFRPGEEILMGKPSFPRYENGYPTNGRDSP
ncbi:MAG TPA: aminotransferase class I/II-fold pyridoxal phosphate-dependent enzyme, partial [Desulfosporosinus sp.]